MKFSQVRSFEKHLASSAPHHFAPVYIILVKDATDRTWMVERAKRRLIGEGVRSIAIFETDPTKRLMQELSTLSLLREERVVIAYFEAAPKGKADELIGLIKQLPKETRCLIAMESLAKSTALYKAVEEEGVILELPTEKSWERERSLTEWLLHEASELGKTIAPQAVQLLVKGVWGSYARLSSEWEKLLMFVGERAKITLDDVSAISSLEVEESSWALGDALLAGDGKKALESALQLIEQGSEAIQLLRQIRHQLMTAFQTAVHSEEGTLDSFLVKMPHLKGALLQKQLNAAARFGIKRLAHAVAAIDACEFRAKDGISCPKLLLTQLLAKLL